MPEIVSESDYVEHLLLLRPRETSEPCIVIRKPLVTYILSCTTADTIYNVLSVQSPEYQVQKEYVNLTLHSRNRSV